MNKKNLKDKLTRFSSHIAPQTTSDSILKLPSRYNKMAECLNGTIINRPEGSYCEITRHYPKAYQHGQNNLEQINTSIPEDAFRIDESGKQISISDLLFFDIETTGLGGSGAVPFLVGCGSVHPDGFKLRQYLLVDYPDETAMLEDILREFTPDKYLVSYNGASFDLPFMKDRMIINRVAREFRIAGHLDLLHATRRFFKRRLKDCSLTNIERELLDFHRIDDIPGYLVPSIFFEWLSSESLDMMEDVLEHNRLDILSLYFIILEIKKLYLSEDSSTPTIDDLHSLSKLFGRRKKHHQVQKLYKQIEKNQTSPVENDILYYHSIAFKKTNNIMQAVNLWQILSDGEGKEAYFANIELAKYYEHTQKDYKTAFSYTQKAESRCPDSESRKKQLSQRLLRLSRKMS